MLKSIIRFFLENKLVTVLLLLTIVIWGIVTSPFGWQVGPLPSDPVPVDAIPDIGENQQIVFTQWKGRSPQDIEDQISYPLTTYLLGIPGVRSVRSSSVFGFSSIYIIFKDDVEFYWSRSRILEKLNSLPTGLLPNEVQPALGPDATALGQVFWYTLEGRDTLGNPAGGWDLHEIRTAQDFYVKYALNAVEGVSEVASIGGFVQEYQIDVNPDALNTYNIPLHQVMQAVQKSNRDVGAKTIEINQVEYMIRGLGYIKKVEDLEQAVVAVSQNVPIRIKDIGVVSLGPATRRGALDKDGAEAVGGVIVARYGSNPLEVITNVKAKIEEIKAGLPKKMLADGRQSQLTIIPFYDRSTLIFETLGTLEEALTLEILISILVVIVMVYNLRASLLISTILPISVLMVFIAMRQFNVDANIVALSGIAIAIGTMVDLGIILSENILKHIHASPPDQNYLKTVLAGASEVAGAILTAVATTIVSFIPVFSLEAAEGKLFGPLAYTKTFALIAALLVSLLIMPSLAHWFFGIKVKGRTNITVINVILSVLGMLALIFGFSWAGMVLLLFGLGALAKIYYQEKITNKAKWLTWILDHFGLFVVAIGVAWLLSEYWLPLGPGKSALLNFLFVFLLLGIILGGFSLLEVFYRHLLSWCLRNKFKFLLVPVFTILLAANMWLGFGKVFGFVANGLDELGWNIRPTKAWSSLSHTFPGLKKEFMPALDEGSFLLMPTSMPHSGVEFNRKTIAQLDMLLSGIPEVELAVGKLGRVESALDPAPINMYENIINYKSEYIRDKKGHRQRFKVDRDGRYFTVSGDKLDGEAALSLGIVATDLIQDNGGKYFRNWREEIQSPDDIWDEIIRVSRIPGVTSAPKLQPIETRLVMLQTGMRAPMGVKVYGPDLSTIESFGMELEAIIKEAPGVKKEAVFADRIVGKPYLHIEIDRNEIGRFGLSVEDVQKTIETAIGGMQIGATVEGRERYPIRVRYPRELRDHPESMGNILVSTPIGVQVPLSQLVAFKYERGPQAIRSEDTFLVGYVLFDKLKDFSEVEVVKNAQEAIQMAKDSGFLEVPPGISYKFSGNYENQVRAENRLMLIVPVVLVIVFLILYFQFRSISTSLMVFTGIAMAFSGGFVMLWLYGQGWFADFSFFGTNFRDLFHMDIINLSVAVWVGFIALFGIATDDGVLMATYLDQSLKKNQPSDLLSLREAIIEAGQRRIKPAAMTSATTIIALLPILTSTGRGADIMIPMAIPAFGGMLVAAITYFIVPVLYAIREESKLKRRTT